MCCGKRGGSSRQARRNSIVWMRTLVPAVAASGAGVVLGQLTGRGASWARANLLTSVTASLKWQPGI